VSEVRALTNTIGNGLATLVVSRWERQLDPESLKTVMAHPIAVGEQMETP